MSSSTHATSLITRLTRLGFTPLGVTSAVVVVAAWVALTDTPFATAGLVATITLLMIATGLIVIGVHEFGHFLVSRLAGFRTISVTVGPVRFVKTANGVRIRSAESWQLGGGMLVCLPRHETNLRARWMCTVAAGPAFSLLLAFGGWLVAPPFGFDEKAIVAIAGTIGPIGTVWWVSLLPTVSVVSFIAAVASLIPTRRGLLFTDGAQLRLLARGGAEADRWCSQIMITAAARGGVRPRDWDPNWIARVTTPRDDSAQEALGQLGAFYWALDQGNSTLALAHLTRAHELLETLPPLLRALVHLDTAFYDARIRGDLRSARDSLGKSDVPGVPRFARLRTEAAVLLLEGDRHSAAARAREGLEELARLERNELVRYPAEEEWLRNVLADAEVSTALSASSPLHSAQPTAPAPSTA
ncbi:MAG TPA: M50 family metallopeptidase [Gemmatimonadaceae bacterium]|nr:M50 family metallopeptidase [Gemmatimonadaceae bacterium]